MRNEIKPVQNARLSFTLVVFAVFTFLGVGDEMHASRIWATT